MPREAKYATEVRLSNQHIAEIAQRSTRAEYVNLWPALASQQQFRSTFTVDELHFTGAS